jgi:hypothetical protein
MRRTCNRGLTNPEYESTQQDLTDKTSGTTQECRLRENKVRFQQEVKFFFA